MFAARAAGVLLLADLACVLAWSLAAPFGWRQALAWAATAAAGAAILRAWRRAPAGMLRWDGSGWNWEEGGRLTPGRPDLVLDLQSLLLLRWRPEAGAGRWLWLARAAEAARWEALRRAVYSRASTPVPADGAPPAAER